MAEDLLWLLAAGMEWWLRLLLLTQSTDRLRVMHCIALHRIA
jgi:hypothetical protein